MERIKQALERAREQRESAPDSGKKPYLVAENEPVGPDAIQYKQTRLAGLSASHLHRNRIIIPSERDDFVDAYKILRTQVLQRMKENNWISLAVTSPRYGEGKTTTAINLATSLAMELSHTVLLADADLRNPSLHEHLGLPNGKGLTDYLLDDAPIPEILLQPKELPHVVVLPAGRPVDNSAELLNSPKMVELISEMRTRYPERLVVVDVPPVLSSADALTFAPYVDATLLVVEDGGTSQEDLKRAVELLDCTNVIGTVLNKVRNAP